MNTHPNTPFGKFFAKLGIWHPHFEDTIKAIYADLQDDAKEAIHAASGIIAVINEHLKEVPDFVYKAIQKKYPSITPEHLTELLNKLNSAIQGAGANLDDDYDTALTKLQQYLGQ